MSSLVQLTCDQLQAFHILATAHLLTPLPPHGRTSYLLHRGCDKCFALSQVSCAHLNLLFPQPTHSPGKLLPSSNFPSTVTSPLDENTINFLWQCWSCCTDTIWVCLLHSTVSPPRANILLLAYCFPSSIPVIVETRGRRALRRRPAAATTGGGIAKLHTLGLTSYSYCFIQSTFIIIPCSIFCNICLRNLHLW